MPQKQFLAMVSALEAFGLVVRQEEKGHLTCHSGGREILNAKKGNRQTYLVRYAEGVKGLVK